MSWRKGERPKSKPWGAARRGALDRDGWHCVQCGKYGRLEVDYIQPLEDGGELYDASNLQTLCRVGRIQHCRLVGENIAIINGLRQSLAIPY